MADTVRFFMEEMVPELQDMEEKGYFTKQEIREIVRKRENFEYALKRKMPAKADFLRYVEYETGLEEVLKLRKAAYGIKAPPGRAELGGVRRCHTVFERATKKYKGDLRLWLAWMDFCKASGGTRQMSKVLTKVLQLHPKEAGLWSYAAAWEFGDNRNAAGARSLMQQGLRVCGKDEGLWLEYLRMELVYAQKLRARQKILGIKSTGAKLPEIVESQNESGEEEKEADGGGALKGVLSGGVARVVLKNALASVPDSLDLRKSALEILETVTFPGVESIAEDVYADMEARHGDSEEAWDLRARRCSGAFASPSGQEDPPDPLATAVRTYEAALAAVPSSRMVDLYAAFLLEQVDLPESKGKGHSSTDFASVSLKGKPRKAAKRVLDLYKKAAELGTLSEASAHAWPELALACGRVGEARKAVEAGTAAHPHSAALCSQALTFAAQTALQEGEGREAARRSMEGLALKGLAAVKEGSSPQLWVQALQTFLDLEPLLQLLQQQLMGNKAGPLQGGMGEAASVAVNIVREEKGIAAAREVYRALLKLPPAGGDLFHTILDLELAEKDEPLSRAQQTALLEAAVDAYGKWDTRLWMRYAKFEAGKGQGSGTVYWRACKALLDPAEFVAKMTRTA